MSIRSEKRGQQPPKKSSGIRLSKAEKVAIPIIIILAIWIAYSVSQPPIPNQQTGTTGVTLSTSAGAPDFSLPVVAANGLTGQTVSLSSFRGKVVVLEFMEPWCPHCQNIAPKLENLYRQYGSRVVFLAVAGPWSGTTADDTAKFITQYGSSLIYVYDSTGAVMNMYRVSATPTFYIVGKDGSIVSSCDQGETCYDTLASALQTLGG